MRKLTLCIFLALCVTFCYADRQSCVNFYEALDEKTGKYTVEGKDNGWNEVDNGEYYQGSVYSSVVTEQQDGVYTVVGSYSQYVHVGVMHQHLCDQIYNDEQTVKRTSYTLTRKRDPTKVGQGFAPEEVKPNTAPTIKSLLEFMANKAVVEEESLYVIQQIQGLADSVQVSYQPY